MKKKILISTGGTGGHVIPSIVFYEHLKENFDVLLVVDQRGSKFINKEKYRYTIMKSPRLSLSFFKLPLSIINFIISILKSLCFLKKNKIDILVGTGGYMSVPICLAAKFLKIKVYLFEPNMVLGRANKFLLKFCSKIFCYTQNIKNFPNNYKNKIYLTSQILRKNLYKIKTFQKQEIQKKMNLLIVGGSQGAKFFDENLKIALVSLSQKYDIKVNHQVSSTDLKDLENFYKDNQIENNLFNFEEDIFKYLGETNIAITRAGAITLSELAFLKIPFIAIPYKFATDNHQLENAIYYEKKNCCWIIKEEEFKQNKLTTLLINIMENSDDYLNKEKSLEKFSNNNWNNLNKNLLECLNEN